MRYYINQWGKSDIRPITCFSVWTAEPGQLSWAVLDPSPSFCSQLWNFAARNPKPWGWIVFTKLHKLFCRDWCAIHGSPVKEGILCSGVWLLSCEFDVAMCYRVQTGARNPGENPTYPLLTAFVLRHTLSVELVAVSSSQKLGQGGGWGRWKNPKQNQNTKKDPKPNKTPNTAPHPPPLITNYLMQQNKMLFISLCMFIGCWGWGWREQFIFNLTATSQIFLLTKLFRLFWSISWNQMHCTVCYTETTVKASIICYFILKIIFSAKQMRQQEKNTPYCKWRRLCCKYFIVSLPLASKTDLCFLSSYNKQ